MAVLTIFLTLALSALRISDAESIVLNRINILEKEELFICEESGPVLTIFLTLALSALRISDAESIDSASDILNADKASVRKIVNTGPDSSQINNSSFSKMLILFNTIDSASDILNADKASVRKIVNTAMRSSKRKLLYESFLLPSPQA